MLARVREFLPEIERSNVELSQRDPRSIDIEHIEETDEHVVEMASPQKLSNHSLGPLTGQVTIYIYNEIRTWVSVSSNNGRREDHIQLPAHHPLNHLSLEAWAA